MKIRYAHGGSDAPYQIVFLTRDGTRLVAGFVDEPAAWAFYNRLRHSRGVTIVRHPNWK